MTGNSEDTDLMAVDSNAYVTLGAPILPKYLRLEYTRKPQLGLYVARKCLELTQSDSACVFNVEVQGKRM